MNGPENFPSSSLKGKYLTAKIENHDNMLKFSRPIQTPQRNGHHLWGCKIAPFQHLSSLLLTWSQLACPQLPARCPGHSTACLTPASPKVEKKAWGEHGMVCLHRINQSWLFIHFGPHHLAPPVLEANCQCGIFGVRKALVAVEPVEPHQLHWLRGVLHAWQSQLRQIIPRARIVDVHLPRECPK